MKPPRGTRSPLMMGIASIGAGLASMMDALSGRPSPRMRRLRQDMKVDGHERLVQDGRRLRGDLRRLDEDRARWGQAPGGRGRRT